MISAETLSKNLLWGFEESLISSCGFIGIYDYYNKSLFISFWKNVRLQEKCLYSELFWSVFSRIRSEYGEILGISPYSVRVRENTDQNNSEYGHFLRSTELELSKVQTGHIFDWIFGRNKLISEYFERKF